jgi:hypothetical protein
MSGPRISGHWPFITKHIFSPFFCTLSVIIEEEFDFHPTTSPVLNLLQYFLFRTCIFPVRATSASCSIHLQILHIAILTDTFYTTCK